MKYFLLSFLLIGMAVSCQHNPEQSNSNAKVKTVHHDVPFEQEYHEGYVVKADGTDANDVRAIQPDKEGNIWIASKGGIFRKSANSGDWELMIKGIDAGPAYHVILDKEGQIWAATWNGVYRQTSNSMEQSNGPKPPIAKLVAADEGIYALGPYGVWLMKADQWQKLDYPIARSIRAAKSDGEEGLWIGTDVGLYHCSADGTKQFRENDDLLSAYVKGIDQDGSGNWWVGGLGGVSIRNSDKMIGQKTPADGIPNAEVTAVRKAPDGQMWVGTQYGIVRFRPDANDYSVRLSRRWLMSDQVRDIAFDQEGNAWIATSKGVSAIKKKSISLENKADYYYDQLIRRHVREPWIVGRFRLTTPGDTTTIVPDDDDNDGEYTAMYLAMESLRYVVTKDPVAKERAKKAFDFLHLLREVTEMDGFFARTIIPADWDRAHDMNRTYTERELAEEIIKNPRQKPVEKRWHLSKDGKWKWKGDTSSDELCGHLYGYYWYYTLVADDTEKQRVADHFAAIADHLIRNDFYLVGVDGKHTKWGVWSPKSLNEDPEWAPEKALNSMEVLSFMKFAHYITGKEKYQEAYLKLIHDEVYIENAKKLYTTNPAWETYFDIYLALYVYPPLLQYEKDPELLNEYRQHLDQWFEKFRSTKSPLVNFSYNYLADNNEDLNNSIFFLQDAPLSLVDWHIDNGRREDLQVVRDPILETLQVDELRPPSEYRAIRWDRNPYAAASGNPAQEREPVYWLLPYWLGRYLDLIQAAQ